MFGVENKFKYHCANTVVRWRRWAEVKMFLWTFWKRLRGTRKEVFDKYAEVSDEELTEVVKGIIEVYLGTVKSSREPPHTRIKIGSNHMKEIRSKKWTRSWGYSDKQFGIRKSWQTVIICWMAGRFDRIIGKFLLSYGGRNLRIVSMNNDLEHEENGRWLGLWVHTLKVMIRYTI